MQPRPIASINDLADLIAANRAQLERAFDGEILRLKTVYGAGIIDQALQLAQRNDQAEPRPPCRSCGRAGADVMRGKLVGVAGFEPATPSSRTRCCRAYQRAGSLSCYPVLLSDLEIDKHIYGIEAY